jgi:hypothetical protein
VDRPGGLSYIKHPLDVVSKVGILFGWKRLYRVYKKVDMRLAANMLGVSRVAEASRVRVLYP